MRAPNWLRPLAARLNRTPIQRSPQRAAFHPHLEGLEDRITPAVFTVTTTADSGPGSLRQAILDANAAAGADSINFALPDNLKSPGGWWTIQPLSTLPTITDPVVLDGYSQLGASRNNQPASDNAALMIELDCSLVPVTNNPSTGVLHITAGNSTVTGLVINRLPGQGMNGIQIDGGGGNHIEGNFIGTDVSGTTIPLAPGQHIPDLSALSAGNPYGVHIENSTGNWIGLKSGPLDAPDLGERNIISGINWGVAIPTGGSNVVAGNFIGTDRTGTLALGNFVGVGTGGVGDRIGTDGDGRFDNWERNVISGNRYGVALVFSPRNTVVAGNYIGTDVTGGLPLGNVGAGVGVINSARDSVIGGLSPVMANVIAFNGGGGVLIANYSGTPTGISVLGNAIYGNSGLGIDLINSGLPLPDGVTLNDSAAHTGPNHLQNFPVLVSATGTGTGMTVTGTLTGTVGRTYRVEFFANSTAGHPNANDPADPNRYGEGEKFLGNQDVTIADATGIAAFVAPGLAPAPVGGAYLTATATDLTTGDTSEFSAATVILSTNGLQAIISGTLPTDPVTGHPTASLVLNSQAQADGFLAVFSGTATPLQPPAGATTPIDIVVTLGPGVQLIEAALVIPQGIRVQINGGTWLGGSPALTLSAGDLTITGAMFVNDTDAPTILVIGGHLTLRNCVVQESTGYADAAIQVTSGTADLGTASDPGGNTLVVNGPGVFVNNTGPNPVSTVGDTYVINKADQSIPPNWPVRTLGASSVTLNLTSSSGLPVSYSVTGPATFDPATNVLTITGLGTVTVTASQAGNANYNPAPDVSTTYAVAPASLCGTLFKDFNGTASRTSASSALPGSPSR